MLLGAFLLLNHFGKIECKGDGVSVTELRGHKNQGHLVTLRTKKKRKSPTNKYKQLLENVLNTVFMSKTKILYRRGSGVVDVTGKKTEASAGTDPDICHLRSKLQVRACSMQPASLTRGYGALHISSFSSQWQARSMECLT